MKRILTSLALLVCVILHAQEVAEQTKSGLIKIGIKGGVSLSSLSDNSSNIYSEDFKSLALFEAGAFAEYGLNDMLSLQVEVNYSVKGGERKGLQPLPINSFPDFIVDQIPAGLVPYGNFENKSILEYIEVPILAKVTFGSDWKYYANAGPYVGFLIGATQETSGLSRIYADPFGLLPITIPGNPILDNPIPFNADTDIKDDINSFNVGIIGGIGIIREISNKSELFFEVRGTYGFIALQENDTFGKSKVGSVLFSLGYAYKL